MPDSLVFKLVTSTISIPSELSLAAANLNLELTLIKLDAPSEFAAVQHSLSPSRQKEAEGGGIHTTARKLGEFWAHCFTVSSRQRQLSSLPTEHAFLTQIADKQKLDPGGRVKHGIFSYICGTDASSIWAAATSGENAIQVHLLDYMVAAMFDAPQAVALWMELIDRRKVELERPMSLESITARR